MEVKPIVILVFILLATAPAVEAGFWQNFWDALSDVFTHSGSSFVPYPTQESSPKSIASAPQQSSNTPQATTGTGTTNYYTLHPDRHPLILVHGFGIGGGFGGLGSFKIFQDQLETDGLYNTGPDLQSPSLNSITCDQISRNAPASFKVTYYDQNKKTNIEGYSDALNIIIQKVLQCTGAGKVDIVASSMGGLVSRASINKMSGNKIDKLIMLGTPNDGVYRDIELWAKRCASNSPECADMMYGSSFLEKLKQSDYRYRSQYYTLAAYVYNDRGYLWQLQAAAVPPPSLNVDDPSRNKALDGDGAVRVSSVRLDGARNVVIEHNADCHHLNLGDPNACPEAYSYVVYWLGLGNRPSSGAENTIERSNSPPPATPTPLQIQAPSPTQPSSPTVTNQNQCASKLSSARDKESAAHNYIIGLGNQFDRLRDLQGNITEELANITGLLTSSRKVDLEDHYDKNHQDIDNVKERIDDADVAEQMAIDARRNIETECGAG